MAFREICDSMQAMATCANILSLIGIVLVTVSCKTVIPPLPTFNEMAILHNSGTKPIAPKSVDGYCIALYADAPMVMTFNSRSMPDKLHQGWNISKQPIIFSFHYGNEINEYRDPLEMVRQEYFSATYRAKRTKLGGNDPLAKAKKPRTRSRKPVQIPQWSTNPHYAAASPDVYGTVVSTFPAQNKAIQVQTEGTQKLVSGIGEVLMLFTDDSKHPSAASGNAGKMHARYDVVEGKPNKADIDFDFEMRDYKRYYKGTFLLDFVTPDSGAAVLLIYCNNKAVAVGGYTFRLVRMSFRDRLFNNHL